MIEVVNRKSITVKLGFKDDAEQVIKQIEEMEDEKGGDRKWQK